MTVSHLHPRVVGQRATTLRSLEEAQRDIDSARAAPRLRHLRVDGKPIDPARPMVVTLPELAAARARRARAAGTREETVNAAARASVVHIAGATPGSRPRRRSRLWRFLRRIRPWDGP